MEVTASARNGGLVADPNIVPLIDVLLVLIIIFMVITPKLPTGLPTLVPQTSSTPSNSGTNPIVVQVLPGEKLMINRESSNWDALGARRTDIFKERADRVAFVKGFEEVRFAQVARAIDIMRGVGIDHVGLVTPEIMSDK